MNSRRISVISANSLEEEEDGDVGVIDGDIAAQLAARRLAKAKPKRVLVEPVIALYFAAWVPSLALTQQYIYWRVARDMNLTQNAAHTEVVQRDCGGKNLSTSQMNLLNEVQNEAADWLVYLDLSGDIPGLFLVLFLGTYANVIGRKLALLLPPIGGIVICLTYLVTALFDLPLPVLLVGSVVEALSGGYLGMVCASLFYMEDTLDRGQDPVMFAVSDVSYGVILGLAEVGMGYFIKSSGFVLPLAALLAIHVLNIVYTARLVPDIETSPVDGGFKPACCSCSTFYKRRAGRLQALLGVALLALSLFTMVYTSRPALTTLYQLNVPFCWDSVKIGFFRGIAYASSQIAQTVFTLLLIRPLTSGGVFILSCLSLIAQFLWMTFNTTDWSMYVAPLIGCAGSVCTPVIITLMYNMVPPDEQDEMLVDIFVLDIVCSIIGATIFNLIYGLTLPFFKGFVFLLFTGVMVICIILMIIFMVLKYKHKQWENANDTDGHKQACEMSSINYLVFSTRL